MNRRLAVQQLTVVDKCHIPVFKRWRVGKFIVPRLPVDLNALGRYKIHFSGLKLVQLIIRDKQRAVGRCVKIQHLIGVLDLMHSRPQPTMPMHHQLF